ncbi:hypothetical protein PROFUN_04749 [Planoprotostelium fungivorum]|uniref:ABM domain-containing protein n=1 Tax=Planoprotostelium fungivorum TaxID=1890364 RepID=A0A2P6NG01_9EUKA|nr:hypothetical protein PROFUN_04749 [Planoprotostelium fungivorum]
MPFFLIAELPTHSEESRAKANESLVVLAEQVKEREPFAKPYYFFHNTSDPTDFQIYGFERYDIDASELHAKHVDTEQFKQFSKKVEEGNLYNGKEIAVHLYDEVAGYVERPGTEGKKVETVLIAWLKANNAQDRETALQLLTNLANDVHQNEHDAYTYIVLKSKDDDQSLVVFERYATKEALTGAHRAGKVYQSNGPKMAPLIAQKSVIEYAESGIGYILRQLKWLSEACEKTTRLTWEKEGRQMFHVGSSYQAHL